MSGLIRWGGVVQVETINDQYMVAGGLPDRSSDHAAEVCLMALHLLDAVSGLRFRQIPDQVLQLRIGIHTGLSAVALSLLTPDTGHVTRRKRQAHSTQSHQLHILRGHLFMVAGKIKESETRRGKSHW